MLVHPTATDADRRWSNNRLKVDLVQDPAANIRIARGVAASELLRIRGRINFLKQAVKANEKHSTQSLYLDGMLNAARDEARIISHYMDLLVRPR